MKNILSFAAATAALAVAAPASAATVFYSTGSSIGVALDSPYEASGVFGFRVTNQPGNDLFTAVFTFDNPFDPARGTASISFSSNDLDDIEFISADINGAYAVLDIDNDPDGATSPSAYLMVWNQPLPLGTNTLTINGRILPNGNGIASVGGQLTLNAVPEPATWALFILGFGTIGGAMRRRSQQIRSTKAKLHFA